MRRLVVAVALTLGVALVPGPAEAVVTSSISQGQRFDNSDFGERRIYRVKTRAFYRVDNSTDPAMLTVFKIRGWHKRPAGGCHRFEGSRHEVEFPDGRERSVFVPCASYDRTRAVTKRVRIRFYAPDPCPVVPCPAGTRIRSHHGLARESGRDWMHREDWAFIA